MIDPKFMRAINRLVLGLAMVTTMVVVPCIACDCNNGVLEAVQGTAGSDRGMTASLLRFSQLETGFNSCTFRPNPRPQGNGNMSWNYAADVNQNSAFGPMQFQEDTWMRTLSTQRSYILQLTQQAITQTNNQELRQQYQEFYQYVQNGGSGRPWRYYGGQNGPATIMARALMRSNGLGTGGTIDQMVGYIRAINPNVDAVAVSAYIAHNLGGGAAQAFLRAMRAGQWDVPVTDLPGINDSHVRANPGNWCRNRQRGAACQPLTLREAIGRISNGGVSGQCVQQAFARAGIPTNAVDLPSYAQVTPSNPVVPAVAAVAEDSMRILSSATTAGSESNGNCISNGTSRYCSAALTDGAPPADAQRRQADDPTTAPPPPPPPAPGTTAPGGAPAPGTTGAPGAPINPGPPLAPGACAANNLGNNCLILGDSIAYGVATQITGCQANRTLRTGSTMPYIGGRSARWISNNIPAGTFDTVVISAGTNEDGSDHLTYLRRIRAELERRNPNVRVVWIEPSLRPNQYTGKYGDIAPRAPLVRQVQTEYGDQIIRPTDYWPDGIHPNPPTLAREIRRRLCTNP